MSLTHIAAVLALVVVCAGCGQSAAARTPSDLLITADDLPAGYTLSTPEPASAIESERQDCVDTLDALETRPADDTGVVEQRVLYRNALLNGVQEVVRRYADASAADAVFGQATAVLACCSGPFSLRYRDNGITLIETVTPADPGRTRNRAWAADITATAQNFPNADRLTLLLRGPTLAIVSVVTSYGPDPDAVADAVSAADQRLAAADPGTTDRAGSPAPGPGCAGGSVRA